MITQLSMKKGPVLQEGFFPPPPIHSQTLRSLSAFALRVVDAVTPFCYKLEKHPEYKTSVVLLKANIQTLGQF